MLECYALAPVSQPLCWGLIQLIEESAMASPNHKPHVKKINFPIVRNGFTLIEMMIVLTVVGILAATVLPSYRNSIDRASRAEAKGILLETSQFLERNYSLASRYDKTSAGVAVALPYTTSPKTGTAKYNISVNFNLPAATVAVPDPHATTFTLSAAPTGTMASDSCGTLTLTETGQQGSGGTVAECWQR
jgi:type IV pilus assembly protein PilE